MELKVVKENGVKKLDTSVAQRNLDKYSVEEQGLASALERTNFELDNAERILDIISNLSNCWETCQEQEKERFFFLFENDKPAVPVELSPYTESTCPPNHYGYKVIPLGEVKRVKCPGCTEMRELIGYYVPRHFKKEPGLLVLCGNSVHIIRSHI